MYKYTIRKVVHQHTEAEWKTDNKEEAKEIYQELSRHWDLYPLVIIDGSPCTIAQAERHFEINKKWRNGYDG